MTLHYHGTPITPLPALYQLAGKNFCVSFAKPQQVKQCHDLGQSVMLDNGAFSVWKQGVQVDWQAFYKFCDQWLDYPNTWAVVPDVIDGTEEAQDGLLAQWPHGSRGAAVWHMNESFDRLRRLVDNFGRVCIGSTGQYAAIMSREWIARMDEIWTVIVNRARRHWVHMLRGMQCAGRQWPFASVDSTDVARNHNRPHNVPWAMADRWDAMQCPPHWKAKGVEW